MWTVDCNLVQPTMLSFGSRVGLTVVFLLERHTGLSQTRSEAGPTTVHMRILTLLKKRVFNRIFRGFTYIPARRGSSLRITSSTQFHFGTVLWAAQVLLQVMHIFIWHGHFRYVSNVVAAVAIVMHCTMTCLQDGKYCGDSYPPGSLGIRDAGWEKGVYCLLSICFC